MKIVYFGTDVYLSCFELLAREHEVLALYTYHNDEDYFTEYNIVRRATELGIPVHYETIRPSEILDFFRSGCELFFVAEYNRILELPPTLPHFRGINVHGSALPQGRSYYPIECAMDQALPETGVTLHELIPRVDSGPILAKRCFPITEEMDSVDVYLHCAAAAHELLEEILKDFEAAWAGAQKQTQRLPYWKRPPEERLTLHHGLTRAQARQVFRRANAMTQVILGGRWHFVTALMDGPTPLTRPEERLSEDRWLYQAADGHLRLTVHPIPKKEREQ